MSVTDAQRAVLEGWVRRRTTTQLLSQRSRIVLECAAAAGISGGPTPLLDWMMARRMDVVILSEEGPDR
ncbi:hypothetical protein ACWD6R_37085 [Streptomyces sp. NPDC005151]